MNWRDIGPPNGKARFGGEAIDRPFGIEDRVDALYRLERGRRDRRRLLSAPGGGCDIGEFEELAAGMMAWMPPLALPQPLAQAARALAERKEHFMPNDIALVGLDIAKSVFQVHGAAADGRAVLRRRLRREAVEPFFRALPPCLSTGTGSGPLIGFQK